MTNPDQKETSMKKRKPLGLVFVAGRIEEPQAGIAAEAPGVAEKRRRKR